VPPETEPRMGVASGGQSHERSDPRIREAIMGEVEATQPMAVDPVGEGGANRWVRVGSLRHSCLIG
jgi:hypothetical protein